MKKLPNEEILKMLGFFSACREVCKMGWRVIKSWSLGIIQNQKTELPLTKCPN